MNLQRSGSDAIPQKPVGGRFGGQQCSRAHGRLLGDPTMHHHFGRQPKRVEPRPDAPLSCRPATSRDRRLPTACSCRSGPAPLASRLIGCEPASPTTRRQESRIQWSTTQITGLLAFRSCRICRLADLLCRSRITISAWDKGRCGHRLRAGRSGRGHINRQDKTADHGPAAFGTGSFGNTADVPSTPTDPPPANRPRILARPRRRRPPAPVTMRW